MIFDPNDKIDIEPTDEELASIENSIEEFDFDDFVE